MGKNVDENVILELIYELCISYELYKGNIKFMRLLASIVFNDSYGMQEFHLLGLVM